MKTTIEISDPLLREARKLAEREGVTLRALVERGLNRVICETKHAAPFKLRRAEFKGEGMQPEFVTLRGISCETRFIGVAAVIAVDTNILVYAHRADSPFHEAALERIISLAEGGVLWAIPWPCLHEFLAIVTHPRIYAPDAARTRARADRRLGGIADFEVAGRDGDALGQAAHPAGPSAHRGPAGP